MAAPRLAVVRPAHVRAFSAAKNLVSLLGSRCSCFVLLLPAYVLTSGAVSVCARVCVGGWVAAGGWLGGDTPAARVEIQGGGPETTRWQRNDGSHLLLRDVLEGRCRLPASCGRCRWHDECDCRQALPRYFPEGSQAHAQSTTVRYIVRHGGKLPTTHGRLSVRELSNLAGFIWRPLRQLGHPVKNRSCVA